MKGCILGEALSWWCDELLTVMSVSVPATYPSFLVEYISSNGGGTTTLRGEVWSFYGVKSGFSRSYCSAVVPGVLVCVHMYMLYVCVYICVCMCVYEHVYINGACTLDRPKVNSLIH